MILDLENLPTSQIYHTLIQTIIPRPIAWVLSENANGTHNLAPFSYFNGVSSEPPIVSISVGRKEDGSQKDTWNNIENRGHFVIHIPHRDMADPVTQSATTLPQGESEIDFLKLETESVVNWPLPRLRQGRVAFLCERFAIHAIGKGPQGLILGRVTTVYLDEAITQSENRQLKIDANAMDPIARLGGNDYTTLGETISIERPS